MALRNRSRLRFRQASRFICWNWVFALVTLNGRVKPAICGHLKSQRLAEQEDRGRAGPFVLVVDTPGTVLRGRHRRAGFLDQLHRRPLD